MATRLYLPSVVSTTAISPTPSASWEVTTGFVRIPLWAEQTGTAMSTVSFADNNAANRDCMIVQFVSKFPLSAGQTVTGSQAIKAQFRALQVALTNNLFLTIGIRIIASDGSTVRKTMVDVGRDDAEAATTLTNCQWTATSAATNYTVLFGDYLVVELGMGGDPDVGSDHDSSIRIGDSAASDLPEDTSTTTDLNPWVELTDTLRFDDLMPQASF